MTISLKNPNELLRKMLPNGNIVIELPLKQPGICGGD